MNNYFNSLGLPKFETKTDFYNMVFNAHSKNVILLFRIKKKSYYDLKLFIYYVFVKKLEL